MIKVGTVLQKIGQRWGSDCSRGEYVVIYKIDNFYFYYRYESTNGNKECIHQLSGPFDIGNIGENFKIIEE